jgi:hypothetical protein
MLIRLGKQNFDRIGGVCFMRRHQLVSYAGTCRLPDVLIVVRLRMPLVIRYNVI